MLGILGGIQAKVIFAMALVIAIGTGVAYWYYQDSQATIANLNKSVATAKANEIALTAAIESQNETIIKLEQTRAKDQEMILNLAQKFAAARSEANEVRKKFEGHNLGHLSLNKPGLMERIINDGTKDTGRSFEGLSKNE